MGRKKRWRVYVAGKYSDDSALDVFRNMRKGIRKCSKLFGLGLAPYCPWLDYHFILQSDAPEAVTVEDFYEMGIEWLKVCDAVLVLPDWKDSAGAKKEIAVAKSMGIPIFESYTKLNKYLEGKEATIKEKPSE